MTKQESILKLLQSSNKEQIIQGLDEFERHPISELLPEIVSLYMRNDSDINAKIIFLLTNMKQNSAVNLFILSLNKIKDFDNYPELIRSCWENGLDFSAHLLFFTEIFIRSSFNVALEAFTVIEENAQKTSKSQIKESIQLLKKEKKNISDDNKSLYEELVSLLEHFA